MNGRVAKRLRHKAHTLWSSLETEAARKKFTPGVFYKQLKKAYYNCGRNIKKTRLRYA